MLQTLLGRVGYEVSVASDGATALRMLDEGPTPDVLRRYGIATADALPALHAAQARRYEADGALAARFAERRAHFLRFASRS